MARTDDPFGLLDFAANFLRSRGITHHEQVRTEELAQFFREYFSVPVFARLPDLFALCERLGVGLEDLPPVSDDFLAANAWYGTKEPTIFLRPDLQIMRAEHSLGHELREVLENCFKRVKPEYEGLDTNDNKTMNPESDQFASCLLMPESESRALMTELGYDLPAFAAQTGRSLPSVILRVQHLFSERSRQGPVAGVWLFEAPWGSVRSASVRMSDLVVKYTAQLNGFSMAKQKRPAAFVARSVFPTKGSLARTVELVQMAVVFGGTASGPVKVDLFGELDYLAVAEPFFVRGVPWRVLLTAVRRDCHHLVRPWLERLDLVAASLAW